MFGEVVFRVYGVEGGRAREGVGLLVSGWLLSCVVEWKRVRESSVIISANGSGS